jgi:hypothetical protein
MKGKLTTLLFSILILWGSLSSYGQQIYSAKSHEIKAATENVSVAIPPTLNFAEKELTHFPLAIHANFAYAKGYTWRQRIIFYAPSIHKSVKTYIVFRALRN